MNCKPGDLAVILPNYLKRENVGLLVTVVRMGGDSEKCLTRQGALCNNAGPGGPGWFCDASSPGFPCFIGDQFLRPIRDPGDDAQDETLSWLPVPLPELV